MRKDEDLDSLINRADRGMYRAKVKGRNQVKSEEDEDPAAHPSQPAPRESNSEAEAPD